MNTYEFDLVLENISEVSDDYADNLYSAGCDDGTPVSRDGTAWVRFDRVAPSLEEAIQSAIAEVQRAGLTVARVESLQKPPRG